MTGDDTVLRLVMNANATVVAALAAGGAGLPVDSTPDLLTPPASATRSQTSFGPRGTDDEGRIEWLPSGQNPLPVGTSCRQTLGPARWQLPRDGVDAGLPVDAATADGSYAIGLVNRGAEYTLPLLPAEIQPEVGAAR